MHSEYAIIANIAEVPIVNFNEYNLFDIKDDVFSCR